MKILLATNNANKLDEIKSLLNGHTILSAKDFPEIGEPEENGDTLEANALIKAKAFYDIAGVPSLADDTGLFVEALGGEPGVYSARYAGENAEYKDNVIKLLKNLSGNQNRKAYFKTVMCLYDGVNTEYFEGICEGEIIESPRGEKGFGYDPVFVPKGYDKTFAEMSKEEKGKISHRSGALNKFTEFINTKK